MGMRALPHWFIYSIPLLTAVGLWRGGGWLAASIVFVFGVIPLVDALVGLRVDNEGTDGPLRQWRFDAPLLSWVPVQIAIQLWALSRVAGGHLVGWEAWLAMISVGLLTGGLGITVAHELMHRRSSWERALAEVLMTTVTYPHFCVEHVHGHHRNVATPLDPASSRLGESVYAYLPRTIVGGLRSAWRIETERAHRRAVAWTSLRRRMTRYALGLTAAYTLVAALFGWVGVAFFVGQSLVAIVLLEVINYVEHYGLHRRELEPGRYERVQPWHSWNASHRVTNWLLMNLQRHSDHHFLANRPYHQLRHYDDVPQLPAGYATMVLLALVPPLWHRVMDRRALAWNRGGPVSAPDRGDAAIA
jgi:alkane 1-monooxygenase